MGSSHEQTMSALSKANSVRLARAELKNAVKAGQVSAQELIMNPPEVMKSMKLFDLIKATPKVGPVGADMIMRRCFLSAAMTVGGMTENQRQKVIDYLP